MTDNLMDKIEVIRKQHEFLTFMIIKDSNDWRCGVVQNSNTRFITFYDIAKINNEAARNRFMHYADTWWWQSGQDVPVDFFTGIGKFAEFQHALCTLPRKSIDGDPIGPTYSITEHYLKRVKKKRIELVNPRAA